jgi:hypothetical protein
MKNELTVRNIESSVAKKLPTYHSQPRRRLSSSLSAAGSPNSIGFFSGGGGRSRAAKRNGESPTGLLLGVFFYFLTLFNLKF